MTGILELEKKATRDGYGQALKELGEQREDIVVLDADLSSSTKTGVFAKAFPDRFYNVGVAEQNLVGMAAGFALSGLVPFASSFAMFLAGRAWEIVRNSVAYPGLNVKLVATHSGITVGEDGASHQIIEDIALMRSIPEMNVFVPSDYNETMAIIKAVAELKGPCYVRCGRASVPVIERKDDYQFHPGKGEVLRDGKDITIVACGVMVAEAQEAASLLEESGIDAAVINMASVKPLDEELLVKYAKKTGLVITAEEHNILGGLGSAVAESLSTQHPVPIHRIGMPDKFGQSGEAGKLMDHYGLRAKDIASQARKLLNK
ncbi:MAG TPA: transketolase [Leptospiraceae bacterium]|nr:transketolase [Spirochaetaceae bacterium]HBS06361.1 transketolase [Leptospiraceae bacterium]